MSPVQKPFCEQRKSPTFKSPSDNRTITTHQWINDAIASGDHNRFVNVRYRPAVSPLVLRFGHNQIEIAVYLIAEAGHQFACNLKRSASLASLVTSCPCGSYLSNERRSLSVDEVLRVSDVGDELVERHLERAAVELEVLVEAPRQHEHFFGLVGHWPDEVRLVALQVQRLIPQADSHVAEVRVRRNLLRHFEQLFGYFIQIAVGDGLV